MAERRTPGSLPTRRFAQAESWSGTFDMLFVNAGIGLCG